MIDYDAIATEFRNLVNTAKRNVARAQRRHGVALVRRMGLQNDRTARLVDSTWEELLVAQVSLEQALAGLIGVTAHKRFLAGGKPDSELVDLFE